MMQGKFLYAINDGHYVLRFLGDVRVNLCSVIDDFLQQMFQSSELISVIIDLSDTVGIDSTSLGLLAKISVMSQQEIGRKPSIISTNPDITQILYSMGFEGVFHLLTSSKLDVLTDCSHRYSSKMMELSCGDTEVSCEKVLEAHRYLMGLNEKNKNTFKQLVEALEVEQTQSTLSQSSMPQSSSAIDQFISYKDSSRNVNDAPLDLAFPSSRSIVHV